MDDGSTDDSVSVISAVDDSRIRLIRFSENRGRPAARQAALDAAKGKYLAMLDADDWIYPEKLDRQVMAIENHPEIALISAGMMIIDNNGWPAGVRCTGPTTGITVFPAFTRLAHPPIAHGPSLIRMDAAKQVAYDKTLQFSEDMDFLLHVMLGKPYALIGEALYVYSEHESVTKDKILKSLNCNLRIFRKYRKMHPLSSRIRLIEIVGKMITYHIGFSLGLHEKILSRRSPSPTRHQLQDYSVARAKVIDRLKANYSHLTQKNGLYANLESNI